MKEQFIKFINETKAQLDISILSAKKYLTSDAKLRAFFETPVIIESKTDGIKINVFYTGDSENPWILSYKGMIIYSGEYAYASKAAIKKSSISNSQFDIILNHFKKIDLQKLVQFNLRPGHEFFIEFLMRKQTLSSNYERSHGMVLIAHSPSKYKEKFGRIYSQAKDFITEDREAFAKVMKLDVPQKLFEGVLGSDKMFQNGIKNNNLLSLYRNHSKSFNFTDYKILFNQISELFLEVESKYGGKEEGVIVKYNDGSGTILKIQQEYQVDQNARNAIKDKFRGSPDEEEVYYKHVRLVALEIINQIDLTTKRNLQ